MDAAHGITDLMLLKLEKKLGKLYAGLYIALRKRFINNYNDKDLSKKILQSQEWKTFEKSLAKTISQTNKLSTGMVRALMPKVYTFNANYAAFEIEKGYKIRTAFDLVDEATVQKLLQHSTQVLPVRLDIAKDIRWNRQKIHSVVLRGILRGQSNDDIAKAFKLVVGMNEDAIVRNARTATTSAECAGRVYTYEKAEDMGIKLKQEWQATLDGRTRHSHRELDGKQIEVGGVFPNGCRYPGDPQGAPEEVYNCFVGDTKIASDSDIVRSYKHLYNGELITIKTASGVCFTCTPNHPILTVNGWTPAKLINNGDNLIIASRRNSKFSRRNPHINHTAPSIKAIHKFFDVFGSKRICRLGVNFHGDIPTADVEIITQKRLLRANANTSGGECINNLLFKNTNAARPSKRTLMQHFRRVRQTSLCNIGIVNKPLSFLKRCLRHSQIHRIGTTSRCNPCGFKSLANDVTRDVQLVCQRLDRATFAISVDNVISINKCSRCTHVYNLQTDNNYYFVNSSIPQNKGKANDKFAIAHNCRCTLVAAIKGIDNSRNERLTTMEQSYDEWKDEKKGKHITYGKMRDING